VAAVGFFMALFLFTALASLVGASENVYAEEPAEEPPLATPVLTAAMIMAEDLPTPTPAPTPAPTPEPTPEPPPEPELLYDVPLDDELQRYIREECEVQGVPFEIALALIARESTFRTGVVSETNDYGLMQINACNHEWLAEELGITDIMDPEQNVRAGLYILGGHFEKYKDPHLALMAYNMGERGAKEAWDEGSYSTNYSRGIVQAAGELIRKEA